MRMNAQDFAVDAGTAGSMSTLIARLACEDLVLTTLQLIDDGVATSARPLFTDEGVHTVGDTVYQGASLTQMLADREARGGISRHTVTNLVFRQLSDDQAIVRSVCIVYALSLDEDLQRRIPYSIVDFRDVLERQGDRWLIARREATPLTGKR